MLILCVYFYNKQFALTFGMGLMFVCVCVFVFVNNSLILCRFGLEKVKTCKSKCNIQGIYIFVSACVALGVYLVKSKFIRLSMGAAVMQGCFRTRNN